MVTWQVSTLACPWKNAELAFEYAVKNNVVVPESWIRCKKAGKPWWLGFKKRQNLSIRAPEATSIGRASGFNEAVVKEYFNNLANVLDKHHFTADRIFNIDKADDALFVPQDIVLKLLAPLVIGGSARKSSQLRFDYDFSKLDLA